MRAGATVVIVSNVLVMVALPALGLAQSPTVTRGAFTGSVSTDTMVGALRGTMPQGATVGAARGSLPEGATVGVPRGGTPVGSASLHGTLVVGPGSGSVIGPLGVPQGAPVIVGPRGSLPPGATTGTFSSPIPPGTRLGEPGPSELEQRLRSEARISMWDGNYAKGEAMLKRSVSILEEIVGSRIHPEVAEALESNAKLLREFGRDAVASEMEDGAKEIRTKLEPPPAP